MPTAKKIEDEDGTRYIVASLICPDCGSRMDEPQEEGEITSCQVCGCEMTMEKGKIIPFEIIGEDWGE